MTRIAIGIEYDGTHYHGWQKQDEVLTIQHCVEAALSQVAGEVVAVTCAGRTDAGVHATLQVAHFDTDVTRVMRAWVWGANSFLPRDIRILWSATVAADFHARFSATARYYRYIIYNRPINSAIYLKRATWCYRPLSEAIMNEAAQTLVGEHDFSSFRASDCQAKSPIRRIEYFKVERHNDFIILEVKANAFLHHMVRNMAGTLIAIGTGEQSPVWIREVLEKRDRRLAGMTADSAGLYLLGVDYPTDFGLMSQRLESCSFVL
jgi:tRNA pseudouridine38-40 synthase